MDYICGIRDADYLVCLTFDEFEKAFEEKVELASVAGGEGALGVAKVNDKYVGVVHDRKTAMLYRYIKTAGTIEGAGPLPYTTQDKLCADGTPFDVDFVSIDIPGEGRVGVGIERKPVSEEAPVKRQSFLSRLFSKKVEAVKGNGKILSIELKYKSMRVAGKLGSVCMIHDDDVVDGAAYGVAVCSMYDFLLYLCQYFGKNVLEYDTIQIWSDTPADNKHRTVIILDHSPQAERYYTKMRLESASPDFVLKLHSLSFKG